MKKICDYIYYLGVDDHLTELFEAQYPIPDGIAYNSYLILDEKAVVFDTVCGVCDASFDDIWLTNLSGALAGRKPDYLVVSHMEPDHSSVLDKFVREYPETVIIGNKKTFSMMDLYFPGLQYNRKEVADGEELVTGSHTLKFFTAPFVHWPEVMMTFDMSSGTLFSADAFGKFGALDTQPSEDDWTEEARRYYFAIVGKYGAQVISALNKFDGYTISRICALHGPVIEKNVDECIARYRVWGSYGYERNGALIVYASVYGHTAAAAGEMADCMRAAGICTTTFDLVNGDRTYAVAEAFKNHALVICSPTYNGDIFPAVREFMDCLTERNYQGRIVGFIENGSWGPVAARQMRARLEKCRDITYIENVATVRCCPDGAARVKMKDMAGEILTRLVP